MRGLALAIAISLFCPALAGAGDVCDWYRKTFPHVYQVLCSGGKRKASVAGAHSTFSTGFNLNAGVLPTEPTSYGLEGIGSVLRSDAGQWQPTFALIKGFHKIGTGVSTSGNSTFYGNDVLERTRSTPELKTFKPLEAPAGYVTSLNLGTSIAVIDNPRGLSVGLGLSGRDNKTTNTFGGGPGLLLSSHGLSAGLGITRERVSNFLPAMYFYNGTISAQLGFMELEYALLTCTGGLGLDPIHIGSLTLHLGRFMFTAAVRHLNYLSTGSVNQEHFAGQVLISKSISVGVLYNYIPGATSFAAQYYL